MIPTRIKSKLPKHLSYPIGAASLSEGLADVPHAVNLTVSFRDLAVWPASEFRRLLKESVPYTIVRAEFHPAQKPGYGGSRSMIDASWYDENWQIVVYPVLREFRHLANRLLREQGLGRLAQWLRASQAVGWTSQYQTCGLVFDPSAGLLSAHGKSS